MAKQMRNQTTKLTKKKKTNTSDEMRTKQIAIKKNVTRKNQRKCEERE